MNKKAPGLREDDILILNFVEEAINSIGVGSKGRFGSNKIFIYSIYEHAVSKKIKECYPKLDLPLFKRWLISMNTKSALTLARADLVGSMDQDLVKKSEIVYMGVEFHFVLDHKSEFINKF